MKRSLYNKYGTQKTTYRKGTLHQDVYRQWYF